jgi:alanyl-tRNA synthetase
MSKTPRSMTADQLRRAYLDFFVAQAHAEIPSAPLVPENDPTTLFTSSGMQPLIPYLLGEAHPKGKRLVDSQKSFRANDIEEIGDNRHTTFFEMLGNWSLGDYFKKEQLRWFFTFLTKELGLTPEKLFVTVYRGNEALGVPRDTESVAIWQELFGEVGIEAEVVDFADRDGMQGGRIFYYDDKKNWWSRSGVPGSMPAGEPGGPDSEMFYDFGAERGLHESSAFAAEPCHVNCDCGRFLEIGNSVFIQYQKQADGSFQLLKQQNVDFGGGFERILAVIDDEQDMFKTDLFSNLLKEIESISGQTYETGDKRAFRIIADHIRAATMLAADGVFPGSKEQGYFVRRLLRRAIRYGLMISISENFLERLVPVVAELYATAYPDVKKKQTEIIAAFSAEETKFRRTLSKGLREFDRLVSGELTAAEAFSLYETYGFPLELSQEEAAKREIKVPEDLETAFAALRDEHAASSRTASAGKFKGGLADHSETTVKYHTATHLLHAALRQELGTTVQQKGSNITVERLRFDFSFERALTSEEITKIETQINAWINADLPMVKHILPKTEALKSGAIAFFANYPDEVSVYTIGVDPVGPAHDLAKGWISKEFCGGPHVEHTGVIGPIKITKEQSAGSGIRRIYLETV